MEMTPGTAALMAQVIPTLLIVVALEPTLRGRRKDLKKLHPFAHWITGKGRESAVVTSLVSIMFCLYVVFSDQPNMLATYWVVGWTTWLFVMLLLLLAVMFAIEDNSREGG
ncbi:hypothetical protein [Arthrobacter sp. CP30]